MPPPHPATETKRIKLSPAPSPKPDLVDSQPQKSGPQRALECRNLIRETIAELVSKHGSATLDLSVGDPTKYGGTFSVPVPLRDALCQVVMGGKHDGYTHSIGDESVRRAIGNHYEVDFTKIAVTSGCSMALDLSLRALAGQEDSVLVPVPGFPLYETLLKLNGVNIIRYRLDPDNNWNVDVDSFAQIAGSPEARLRPIKAVIVCNPSNPTGSVYTEAHLRAVLSSCKANFPQAVVIADQVYEDVVFDLDSSFVDMGKLGLELQLPTVSVSGLAKGYHAPGWRMGWIICYDNNRELENFRKRVQNLSNTVMGASTIIQQALRIVLNERQAEMREFRTRTDEALRESTRIFTEGLAKIPGVHVSKPKGAMYIFFKLPAADDADQEVSSIDTCVSLLQTERLLLLPGDACFGAPKGYIRALIAVPPEIAQDAVNRITKFCNH
jgi:tyrosine aminotransferase